MAYAIAMPRTYIAERVNPRNRVTLLPWPAIIPERMGIMGRTQGVKDRSNPKPRKLAMISQKSPVLSNPAICRSSEGCWIEPAAGGETASAEVRFGESEVESVASVIGTCRVTGG
jgi:hypothetical protein